MSTTVGVVIELSQGLVEDVNVFTDPDSALDYAYRVALNIGLVGKGAPEGEEDTWTPELGVRRGHSAHWWDDDNDVVADVVEVSE